MYDMYDQYKSFWEPEIIERFEKVYGKELESFDEYYKLLTYRGVKDLSGNELFAYVVHGTKIEDIDPGEIIDFPRTRRSDEDAWFE